MQSLTVEQLEQRIQRLERTVLGLFRVLSGDAARDRMPAEVDRLTSEVAENLAQIAGDITSTRGTN